MLIFLSINLIKLRLLWLKDKTKFLKFQDGGSMSLLLT